MRSRCLLPSLFVAWLCLVVPSGHLRGAEPDPRLKTAQEHLQRGRTEEALEVYEQLQQAQVEPVRVALAMADCQLFEGKIEAAHALLKQALDKHPQSAPLLAKLGEVFSLRGDYANGVKQADAALKIDPELPLAHLVRADALTELGQLKPADEEYRWFVRFYNRAQPTDAETLVQTGIGAAQYARWHSVSSVFRFVVNTLCPDALKDDPNSWQAYALSGSLLLEKYNREDALPELQQALKINPRAADVLVMLGQAAFQKLDLTETASFAERALAVNPGHVGAHQLLADLALRDGNAEKALQSLAKARETNPHDQRTLARVAAAYLLLDGMPPEAELTEVLTHLDQVDQIKLDRPSRFTQTLIDLGKRNPHPGYALQVLADDLQAKLRFAPAEKFYKAAMAAIPYYAEPQTALGLLYMRVGRTDEARKILDSAFEADPFHVRVSNMRKVIKLLDGYSTISTDHFVIRVDSQADAILGKYLAEYLEEIYPELTQRFGFEPPTRTQFEIYNKGKGMSAHQWFSARMTGLPWIQTIGASTGWIVALASPTSTDRGFNWAKVMKHELVHIITLQQTQFNCPHWFTEALAVMSEETPRPEVWTRLLLERVPKGELLNLDNINLGFQRPRSPLEWQLAYCQSHLYATYLVEQHGPESLTRMLDAYRQGLRTPEAIQKVCGKSQAEFEQGYLEYVKALTQKLKVLDAEPDVPLKELRKQVEAAPDNLDLRGQLAFALISQKQAKEARTVAAQVLEKQPTQPLAAVTMAILALRAEDPEGAVKVLEPALNRQHPHPTVIRMLAKLKLELKAPQEAAALYELAAQQDPDNKVWLGGMAVAYVDSDQTDKLIDVLKRLVELDYENPVPRRRLAKLMLERKDYAAAVKYGRLALHIDVMDAEVHRNLATAYEALQQNAQAIAEYQVAVTLDEDDVTSPIALARLLQAGQQIDAARKVLQTFLKAHPDDADAQALLKSLPVSDGSISEGTKPDSANEKKSATESPASKTDTKP